VKRDYAEAMAWFRKAAERGYAPAQYNLGKMYLKGQGVAVDREEARKWLTRAADAGYPAAKKALDAL
jgi:TPR repeat protein